MTDPVSELGTPWNQLPGATAGIRTRLTPRPAAPMEQLQKVFLGPFAHLAATLTGGDPDDWDTIEEIIDQIAGGLTVDFDGLLAALQGTYTGDDDTLLMIQVVAKSFRSILTPGGLLNLGQLTTSPVDLLGGAGGFDAEDSVTVAEGWSHSTDGHTKPGSALFTASGVGGVLFPPAPGRVEAGKSYAASVWVQWAGLVASGATVTPQVRWFDVDRVQINSSALPVVSDPPSSSAGWIELSGEVTAPAGAVWAHLALVVTSAASAGEVWFDDAVILSAQSSLPQSIIAGLTGALESLGDDVEAALGWIKDLIEKLTGQARASLTDAINDVTTFASQLKTILSGGSVGSPLPTLVGATISQISTMLSQLMDILRGLTVTPINSVVSDVKDWFTGLTGWKSTTTSNVTAAQEKADAVQTGIVEGWAGGSSSGADADVFDTMDAIRSAVVNGYMVDTITSSATWTKPTPLNELIVIGVGAGENGTVGQDSNTANVSVTGGTGGRGGSYIAQTLDPTTVGSTVACTIGTSGGTTSFGSYLSVGKGMAGGVSSPTGYLLTSSVPGDGGNGGDAVVSTSSTSGTSGSSSALGAAGAAGANGGGNGTSASGGDGGSVSLSSTTKSGGGGGGGGGGRHSTGSFQTIVGGNGGAGGYPGGGGGGGGAVGGGGPSGRTPGSGGAGANGVIWVLTK